MVTVDARNKPCPEPVLLTKKALEAAADESITVLVDSETSLQNVRGLAQSKGRLVQVTEKNGEYSIEISAASSGEKTTRTESPSTSTAVNKATNVGVLLITGDLFGSGDEELGHVLMTAFINTLPESPLPPEKILFINRGVFLTTEGSGVLDALRKLDEKGVQLLSCGTCLKYYNIIDRLAVGKVTNMLDTVDSLLSSVKVVRI